MILNFENGSTRQKEATRAAVESLINLPIDRINLGYWNISFVPDPDEGRTHSEFAITSIAEKQQGFADTRFRDDAPDFGRSGFDWAGINFYNESVVHELGHALFWNLPQNRRLAVLRMFGVNTDDTDVVSPPTALWENRPGEGVAETFKDAFLPPNLRKYFNRTNYKIPIAEYPRFRSLFRVAGSGRFSYLYGSELFRADKPEYTGEDYLPLHLSEHDDEAFVFYEGLDEYPHGFGVEMAQFKEAGKLRFSIEPAGEVTG